MKKLICALFGLFISVSAFADGEIATGTTTMIKVGWDDIRAIAEKNTLFNMSLGDMHNVYDVALSEDGRLTTKDMVDLCKAAGVFDQGVCYENLVLPLVNRLKVILFMNACADKAVIGYRASCMGGLYSKNYQLESQGKVVNFESKLPYTQDIKVPEYTAYGLAIEYIRTHGYENDLHNIRCSPKINNDWINCTAWHDASNMNSEFFSFHFADTHSRDDGGYMDDRSGVYKNTAMGICAMFGLLSNRIGEEQICLSPCSSDITKVAAKFSLYTVRRMYDADGGMFSYGEKDGCLILPDREWGNGKKLKTYPDNPDMSYAFQTVQTVLDPYLIKTLRLYISGQGIEVRSFDCNYAPKKNDNDYILPCVLNGEEVEFLFDDLYEGEKLTQKAGLSAMACLTAPATIAEILNKKIRTKLDGKYCVGPGPEICDAMSTIVTGGTEWDPETDRCLLKSVAEKEQAEFLTQVVIGGATIILTCAFPVGALVCVATAAMEFASTFGEKWLSDFEKTLPSKYAKEFVYAAEECNIPTEIKLQDCTVEQKTCARNALDEFFGSLDYIMENISEQTAEYVAQSVNKLSQCIDYSVGENIVKNASLKFEVTGVKVAEALCVMVGFVNPKGIGKFTAFERFPKIMSWIKRASETRLGKFLVPNKVKKLYRIDVDNLPENFDVNPYVTRMKDHGFTMELKRDQKTGKQFFEVYMDADAPRDFDRLAEIRSEIDKNIGYLNNGRIQRITFNKNRLSDDEWKVVREELDKKGFDVVEADFQDSFWVIRKSSRSGRNANSADVRNTIKNLDSRTGAKWEYRPEEETIFGYSYYSVRLSDMSAADATMLKNRLKEAGVRVDIWSDTVTRGNGEFLVVREENINDVFRIKPKDFEEATNAGAKTGKNAGAAGAKSGGETPVNPELNVNITRTDKGIKIGLREFVSAVDENGAKYYEFRMDPVKFGPEGAETMTNNLRADGVEAFWKLDERTGEYVVGVYERTLKNIDGVANAAASGVRYHKDLDAAVDLAKTNPTKAARQLLQKYHYDKLPYHSDEIDKLANEITQKINSGLDKMNDAQLRELGRQINQLDDLLAGAAKNVGNSSAGFMGRLKGWKVNNVELVRNNSRNAVFKFKEKGSGKTYYLKHISNQDEIARTKRAYEIFGDNSGFVHTVRVVEDDQDVLIDFVTKNNLQQSGGNYWMLTEEVPSSVAVQGNIYNGEIKNALRGKAITSAEQQEIRNAIKKLNDGGIVHGDLYPNMLFMRESNGKLRVDLIDYEDMNAFDKFADERGLDNMFNDLRRAGLAE